MARRFALYGVASTVFAFGVVSTALRTRANFYAAAVSIGKSSGSMMVRVRAAIYLPRPVVEATISRLG